jgi:hypothetical protein
MHFIKDFKQLAGLNPSEFFGKNMNLSKLAMELSQPGDPIPEPFNIQWPQQDYLYVKRFGF